MSLFKKIVTLVLAMSLMTGCSLTNNADSQKVFNFADSCIVIGAIIIICVLIKEGNNYESNNSR